MSNPFQRLPQYDIPAESITISKELLISVIVARSDWSDYNQELLEKILASVESSMDLVDVVLVDEQPLRFANWGTAKKKFILFGVDPHQIGIMITPAKYQWFQFQNGQILLADELSKIQNEVNLKKQLWAALKQMSK